MAVSNSETAAARSPLAVPNKGRDEARDGVKNNALRWPLIILSLLLLNVAITAALITLSSRDPGLMVERDYDQRALRWDDFARQRRASEMLGWTADVTIDTAGSNPRLIVRLADSNGLPMIVESAEAIAFPQSHASQSQVLRLPPVKGEPAACGAAITLTHPGLWEVRLKANRDGKTFMSTSSIRSDNGVVVAPKEVRSLPRTSTEHE